MVGKYACPNDGKGDGHGEYLPRKAAGVQVPGHTKTPEECIAHGASEHFEPLAKGFVDSFAAVLLSWPAR